MKKEFDVKKIAASFMGYAFYGALLLIITGFIMKIVTGTKAVRLPAKTEFSKVAAAFFEGDPNAAFALGAYVICLSPFVSAVIIITGYLLARNYKASLLGAGLLAALVLSILIKTS